MIARTGAVVLGLALTAGCSGGAAAGPASTAGNATAVTVAASFYPLQWIAERLGGEQASVIGLTPVGTEPHSLVLDPSARSAVEDADVVLYLGLSFQPDVQRAVDQVPDDVRAIDLLTSPGLELIAAPADLGKASLDGDKDPHVWLDPVRMAVLADRAASALVEADPALEADVRRRLVGLKADLAALDAELSASLARCERRTIVTSHAAFGYLADRYDLEQVAIAGLSADAEPAPADLRAISDEAERAGVTTVFFEETLPPDLAETVADEVGARTDLLGALEFDPSQAVGAGEDYLSVMRRNAASLATGLACTR